MSPQPETGDSQPRVYRGPDDTCCPCAYCTAIREGALPIPETRSVWAKRVTGEMNPLRGAAWDEQ